MNDFATPNLRETRSLGATLRSHSFVLFGLLGVMWVLEIADHLPIFYLDRFGIRPRTAAGLWGILCAPFLHAGFDHLIANTVPFFLLGGIVLLGGRVVFWNVTFFVILVGGFGVWLLAPPHTLHLGASGLIFGYLGFLLGRGFYERSIVWSLVAIAVMVLYGGLLWGLLPVHRGVSWQGHLFGFLAGLLAARLLFSRRRRLLTDS